MGFVFWILTENVSSMIESSLSIKTQPNSPGQACRHPSRLITPWSPLAARYRHVDIYIIIMCICIYIYYIYTCLLNVVRIAHTAHTVYIFHTLKIKQYLVIAQGENDCIVYIYIAYNINIYTYLLCVPKLSMVQYVLRTLL